MRLEALSKLIEFNALIDNRTRLLAQHINQLHYRVPRIQYEDRVKGNGL
jgi:hypothetical protein